MKFFLLVAFFIGLSSQMDNEISFEYSTIYPLRAIAVLHGETKDPLTNQSYIILGSVAFEQYEVLGNVSVTVDITGLPPHSIESGLWRGLHIHTYGILNVTSDARASCASTGPHYNPFNDTHGSVNSTVRHIGDLGNVETFKNGTIRTIYNVSSVDLYGPYSVIGRAVVLHENTDDYGLADTDMSRSVGTSGARIACGVIGLDKSVSGSVENGFLTYFMMNMNVTLDKSEPWIDRFISFEDDNIDPATGIHDVIEELDYSDSSNKLTDQPLFQLFADYLKNVTFHNNWLDLGNTPSEQAPATKDELRRKLMKFL